MAAYKPSQLVVFKYEDEGVATLEDGLYVAGEEPEGPGVRRQMAKIRQGVDEGVGLCKKIRMKP